MLFAAKRYLGPSSLRSPLILFIGLTLIRGLLYLSLFPPFLAPDESAHFEAIRLIGQEATWPTEEVYRDTPMHPEMDSTFERFRIWTLVGLYSPTRNLGLTDDLFIHYYPTQIAGSQVVADSYLMFYHLLMAPLSKITASFDLVTQVYTLRLISIIFAMLTVTAAWITIRAVFPTQKIITLGVCSFIVFWPMHTHVTASVNVDGLAELVGTLFFLVVVQVWRKGFSVMWGGILLAVLGIGILTKPTVFFLIPTFISIIILYLGRKFNWRKNVIGGLITILIGMIWFSSIFLYENSKGGKNLSALFTQEIHFPDWTGYITTQALIFYAESLNFAVVSFAGLFGWSNIHIPWSWVWVWSVMLLIVTVGILVFIAKNFLGTGKTKSNLTVFQKDILIIFALALIFAFIGLIAPIIALQSPSWGIHSRYYFPAIVPLALYLFLGVRQLVPVRHHRFLWPGWLMGWVLYDFAIILFVLLPFLYS